MGPMGNPTIADKVNLFGARVLSAPQLKSVLLVSLTVRVLIQYILRPCSRTYVGTLLVKVYTVWVRPPSGLFVDAYRVFVMLRCFSSCTLSALECVRCFVLFCFAACAL